MRISVCMPGDVYDMNDELIVDLSVLSTLDGWHYDADSIYNYFAAELADIGVIGGNIRATWTSSRGLEIVTDYWVPDTLPALYIHKLRDETVAQMIDGIGEGGFEITLGKQELVLVADPAATPMIELVDDGKPVPAPSTIARAARDGNIALIEDALASGEPIDSMIQGFAGLHLAVLHGRIATALFLISKGANINLLTSDGETALHLCALTYSLNDTDSATLAKALLGHGADKAPTTISGDTAASLAENRGKTAMLNVLNTH